MGLPKRHHVDVQSNVCSYVSSTPRSARSGLTVSSISVLGRNAQRQPLGCKPRVRIIRRTLQVQAVSAPEAPSKTYEKDFKLQGHTLRITVEDGTDGEVPTQRLTLFTDMPGKLLLHWGVEGGEGYKAGWRLPAEACWPEGTVKYKDRALQTPFRPTSDGAEVVITLTGGECSDFIDFVVKDTSIDRWFDFNGDNWRVRLHDRAPSQPDAPALKTIDVQDIPQLPQELCGIWAYIKWEIAGCPERSQQDADKEYQQAIEELKNLLRIGIPLDEIWRVARGEGARYQDWIQTKFQVGNGSIAIEAPPAPVAAPAPPAPVEKKVEVPRKEEPEVYIPEDLLGVVAYILWEKAGKPDGADFGQQAKEQIKQDLKNGKTVDDIRKELSAPPPPPPQAAAPAAAPAPAKPAPPAPPRQAEIGTPVLSRTSTIFRAPLEFIKSDRPLLAQEKKDTKVKPLSPLSDSAAADKDVIWQRTYPLGQQAELLVVVRKEGQGTSIVMTTDIQDQVILHWGVKKSGKADWILAPQNIVPPHSIAHPGGIAYETEFGDCADEECDVEFLGSKVPLQRVVMHVPEGLDVSALTFVLRSDDSTMWWRDGGSNFTVPMPGGKQEAPSDPLSGFTDPLARTIVDVEVNSSMWTLMHRFNKASDLLNEVLSGYHEDTKNSMATIFIWLRYSAIRQLTWQRNYNTQPRILGAAQERLTNTVAHAYAKTGGEAQEWVRYMLTCVGRGGNAQAVRDEILNIMHRNKIPERAGTWMEQWHQKLHNNTTPDDVVICEAYLAFLYENGSQDAYWRVLSQGGVTRERLASFERSITVDPEYFPDKQQALIKDCTHYLGILKATHSGAELQSSAAAAGPHLPDGAKGYLGYVLANQGHHEILPLIQNAVECRGKLAKVMHQGNREILYLDLALESLVRSAAERGAGAFGMGAAPLVAPLLANLILSVGENEELCYCLKAWEELPDYCINGANPSQEDALRMLAVVDRIRRAVATTSDKVYRRIAPLSTAMGHAFGVEEWSVDLFAEEVVRSGPAFAVSLVLSSLEQPLRSAANLSSWQVISPGNVTGKLVIIDSLHDVQDKSYTEPTVLFAKRITGEEEVPDGALGLIGRDAPDVLAHLSVRARNMHVLFASCYDEEPLADLQKLEGKIINVATTAGGNVRWSEGSVGDEGVSPMANPLGERKKIHVEVPHWKGKWVVTMDEFKDGVVGAKSKNLAGLRGRLPDWINLPASVTLPFGSFEEVLKQTSANKEISRELDSLVKTVNLQNAERQLAHARSVAMKVEVPDVIIDHLGTAMEASKIRVPSSSDRWRQALTALKGVWASKFNERAYISMRKVGLDFMDIRMAVLCQRVVPAKYAYVIHTRNPTTGDENEVYCEMVLGLGESIVSGMVPGSALAFVARKDDLDNPKVVLYPSKSDGMFVKDSLIFRSDSNGEDLEGYAGAGLYDSITMDPTVLKRVDYNEDPLLKDEGYRRSIMSRICKVGYAIEEALGSAQDVEGVVDHDDEITVVQTRPQM